MHAQYIARGPPVIAKMGKNGKTEGLYVRTHEFWQLYLPRSRFILIYLSPVLELMNNVTRIDKVPTILHLIVSEKPVAAHALSMFTCYGHRSFIKQSTAHFCKIEFNTEHVTGL
jgi:hypothetical protein